MNKSFLLYAIQTTPQIGDHADVVTLVRWGIEFEKNGEKNKALVESILPAPAPEHEFIPLSDLTKDQIINFALQSQGGDAWIANMSQIHENQLDISIARKATQQYTGALQFDAEQHSDIPVEQP